MKTKIFILFCALASCVGMMKAAVVNGSCGDNLTWTLNSKDSALVIEGFGEMTTAPWSEYRLYVAYVTLPSGLTKISEGAFSGCSNVKQLSVGSSTPPSGGANSGINAPTCILIVPKGSLEIYANSIWWEDFARIEEEKTIVPITYTVSVQSNDNDYGYVSGTGIYDQGTQVIITASPKSGFYFSQWSDGNTDNPRTIILTQDTTIIAYFSPYRYTLFVSSSDETKGIVNNVNGEYDYGTKVYVEAIAKDGYIFSHWSDEVYEAKRYVNMVQDTTLGL